MQAYLWIALGGALGSIARHAGNGIAARLLGVGFPWGTLLINVLGSVIIGFAAATMRNDGRFAAGESARLFLMVGICGGFTTFSAFSLQTLTLMQGGQWGAVAGNVSLSVVMCLVGVWVGYVAGLAINPR
jgi:CrcB protein